MEGGEAGKKKDVVLAEEVDVVDETAPFLYPKDDEENVYARKDTEFEDDALEDSTMSVRLEYWYENKGSLANCTFTLTCMSFGIGLFVFPSLLGKVGLVFGIILIAFFAVLSDFTMQLLLIAAKQVQVESYEELGNRALGHTGRLAVALAVIATLFTGNCAHLQFVGMLYGDMVDWWMGNNPHGLAEDHSGGEVFLLVTPFALLALPFCLLPKLHVLHKIAIFTVCFVLGASGCIVVQSFIGLARDGLGPDVSTHLFILNTDVFTVTAAICFAYSGVCTLFSLYAYSLKSTGSLETLSVAVHISNFLCFVVYGAVAVAGYMRFGSGTAESILYNFEPSDYLITVFKFGMLLVITLLVPVLNYPVIVALESIFFRKRNPSLVRRWVISFILVALMIGVDSVITGLTDLFALSGSLGLGSLGYVLPALFFLRVDRTYRLTHPLKLLVVVVLVLTSAITLCSVVLTVKNIVTKFTG